MDFHLFSIYQGVTQIPKKRESNYIFLFCESIFLTNLAKFIEFKIKKKNTTCIQHLGDKNLEPLLMFVAYMMAFKKLHI